MKKRFDLGIRVGTLLPMARGKLTVEKDFFLGIKDGQILDINSWKPKQRSLCKKFIDAKNKICLPGLVNGHTHLPMTLFRGLEDDVPFHVWLFERILPLEGKMVDAAFVRDGTELAALECIRFGVTTVNEMYFFADETAKALDRAGLRGIISQTMADFPLPEDKVLGSDKFALVAGLQKKYKNHRRLIIGFGPHAPYSCGDELLRKIALQSKDAPIHIHVSETAREVEESQKKFGLSPVERLQKLGILRQGTICAHCVHLSEQDREIFKNSGASVVYNPDSNAKLGSGIAPISDYAKRGIPFAFGTDGAASNNDLSLFGAMDLGTKLQKLASGDNTAFTAAQALVAATYGGAKSLGMEDIIGSLEVGKRADLVLVDFQFPHLQPVTDPVSHLVYSAQGLEVDTVVCEGKLLLQEKKFTSLKPAAIYKKAERWRAKIQKELRAL